MIVKIILIVTACFIASYAFLLFRNDIYIKPYIFKPLQKVTPQVFVDYLFSRVLYFGAALCISWLVSHYLPVYSLEFKIVSGLFFLYILDYWLFYNDPLTKPFGIPFSYSLVMGGILIILTVEIIIKWYSLKH